MHTPAPKDDVAATDVEQHQPKDKAAGVPAVAVALKRSVEQMGVVRTGQTLLKLNQTTGYDCPGCAWPDPKPGDRHIAEFCENGAKAVAEEATRRRVTPEFFAEHSIADLASRSDYWLGQQGRLTHPMVRRSGATHYEPIEWDAAFALIAEHLNALDSPDEATFYTSGRTSNEAAYAYQLFVRAFGTNNLPDCSNMCHESTSVALAEVIGIGKGSVTLEDLYEAELLVIVGQNPGTNHPRMLSALEKAKQNGAKILAINPLREAGFMGFRNPQTARGLTGVGTELADLHLPIRVNGDLAFFQAVGHHLLEAEKQAAAQGRQGSVLDLSFIEKDTSGFAEWAAHVEDLDWSEVERATGLGRGQIEEAAQMFVDSGRTITCWAMGITQHRNAVATVKEIANVAFAQGNIGRPGAGLCPVRGHSNVQGDRTMGIWEKLVEHFGDALRDEFGFEPPRERGLDAVDSIRAMRDGKVKVFVGMGGNFVSAAPDTALVASTLEKQALTVQIQTKLNRSHTHPGHDALILPTMGRTERDQQAGGVMGVTVEDSMSSVHLSHGSLRPASPQLRSEVAIICGMALATLADKPGGAGQIDWAAMNADYRRIREHISRTVPGCDGYPQKVEREGGFTLPHPPRDTRTFETPTKRGIFSVSPLEVLDVPEGHLLMQTMRSHDQFNTTIYGHDDRYRGIKGGRDVILMSAEDISHLELHADQLVDISSTDAEGTVRMVRAFRVVEYAMPRGCAAAYYPETNPLVPIDSTALGSNQPASKSVIVKIQPIPSDALPDAGDNGYVGTSDDAHKSGVQPHHLS